MAFNRTRLLKTRPDDPTLTRAMTGIGMNFASQGDDRADIEETILQASLLGMEAGDLRVLSLLTTWLGVHHKHINVDRLIRGASELTSPRACAYWSAIATCLKKDRRLIRLCALYEGPPIELLPVGNAFQISRRGEDERFKGSTLLAPEGSLRDRSGDVLTPAMVAQRHLVYRCRVFMGPSWRADVWAALKFESDVSVAELARRVGCSFATAWQVAQDFKMLYPSDRS